MATVETVDVEKCPWAIGSARALIYLYAYNYTMYNYI